MSAMNFDTYNEWPYPDNDTSPAIMQEWWDENQALWRQMQCVPSRDERFWEWLTDDYLLDGVPIPEWAQGQTSSIPWYERGRLP